MTKKYKLPKLTDDWFCAKGEILKTVKYWLGREKLSGEWVKRDGDISRFPKEVDGEIWSKADNFLELLDGCTGNTTATYVSGMGIRAEEILEELENTMKNCVENAFINLNPDLDFEDIEGHPAEQDLIDLSQEILPQYYNWTLGKIVDKFQHIE